MNTSPQLDRPRRSEIEFVLERELKKLPKLNDEDMLDYARMICLHLKDALRVIMGEAEHELTRDNTAYAKEYMADTESEILQAVFAWKRNPQGMADEIETARLSHDKDVAADLRKGE